MVLVLMGCGVAVSVSCNIGDPASVVATAFAFGLSVVAMAYTIGGISGCHINPAITLGVFLSGKMSGKECALYIVFQIVGASTMMMASLKEGDYFHDFVGPLGCPSEFTKEDLDSLKQKKILFVAGGVGTAPVYPQVKWLHENGIEADVIVGAKNKDLLILEEEMKAVAGNLYVTTDDGSYGRSGMVTQVIKDLYAEGKKYDVCVAIGPMIMMKFVCLQTKELGLPTIVSLNPIMVDGTGMCGACRVSVGGKTKFACVDGPEFDGHEVDFNEAMLRQQIYKTEEGRAFLKAKEGETHHGGCGNCQ